MARGAEAEESLELHERAVALGRFVRALTPGAVPSTVWDYAATIALDTIGCAVGGATALPAAPVLGVTRSLAGNGEATVLGTDITTDCVSAASANAYIADILDFEDTYISHPSVAIVPAAVAVGERVGASGSDVVRAIVAGYEVGLRIGEALQPSSNPGYSGLRSVWLAFPAVAAAGALLDLDDIGWANAFAYTGWTTSLVPPSFFDVRPLTWVKGNWHAQTRAGVFAALLAQAGFRARTPMLEDDGRLAAMLGTPSWRPDVLTADLGESWLTLETTLKPYPCCRFIHPALDAIEEILRRRPSAAADAERIVVRCSRHVATNFGVYRPAEMIDAEFSVPYCVAMMLLGYPYGPRWHEPENLTDPNVHAIADRVHLKESDALTQAHARGRYGVGVELTFSDGSTLTAEREHPRGGSEEPMPEEETRTKFLNLCGPVLGADAAEHAYDLLRRLDQIDDVRTVTAALRPARALQPSV